MGRGAFRKRIIEMGFIRGKEVDVIQNAPLKDPIHYRVMGYDVSLRRNDAQMIEVVSVAEFIEASTGKQENRPVLPAPDGFHRFLLPGSPGKIYQIRHLDYIISGALWQGAYFLYTFSISFIRR